jgi:hypothetical protein
MLLTAASPQCVEQAAALCMSLGPIGPIVLALLGAAVVGFERWRRHQAERQAADKLAAAEEKLAKVKAERNEHAARAHALEVKVASLRPPPMNTADDNE